MPEWLGLLAANFPLAAAVTYGFLSRRLRTDGEFKDQERAYEAELLRREAQHAREIAYLDARRTEEREGRLSAERRIAALTERWDRALQLLGSIERETIRAASSGRRRPQPAPHGDDPAPPP